MRVAGCPYCDGPGGRAVWMDPRCRVVFIEDAPFAGLCRVIWNDHVRELSDLGDDDRSHVIEVVSVVEKALRDLLRPDKMNLAALGTHVPHLHWHVIPRYRDDTHYPDPIWAAAQRPASGRTVPSDFVAKLTAALADKLGAA
jgi:diadenosine tetraphosphate (Ap4A) HIT family hydrolase